MSLFGGITDALFGGGGTGAASKGMREGYFNPYDISGAWGGISSTPGYVPTKKEWKQGMRPTPGSFSASMSPEQQMLRSGFLNAAMGQLGGLGQSTGGYMGITPQMLAEFGLSNNDLGQRLMDAGQGYLNEEQAMGPYDFDKMYQERLANMRALDAPLEERGRLGSIQSQFGKGILASTAGGYQTEGLERALAAKDLMRHDSAFNQALSGEQQYMQNRQMLQNAGLNFNLQGNNSVQQRFARAMDMFGLGQQAETLGSQRANSYLGGVGSIDQFMANLMSMGGQLGSMRSGANQGAYAPLIQAQMQQSQMGADFLGGILGGLSIPFGGGAGFNLPGKAMGGPVMPGQPYIVGEQGPEIVVPQQGGNVIPNHMLPAFGPQMPPRGPTRAPMPFEGSGPIPMPFKGGSPTLSPFFPRGAMQGYGNLAPMGNFGGMKNRMQLDSIFDRYKY